MRKFKKLMTALLVAILVVGSSLTIFAADATETQNNLDQKTFPVNLSYSRDDAGGSGTGGEEGDDSKRDIINIGLEYDDLNFEYKADSIVWNPDIKDYEITINDTSFEKGIKVTNNSNIEIGVTPGIDNTNAKGVPIGFAFDFTRVGDNQKIASADNLYGTGNLNVSALGNYEKVLGITNDNVDTLKASMNLRSHTGGNLIDSDVESFEQKITTITLAFRAASTNQPSGGGSHTGGSN